MSRGLQSVDNMRGPKYLNVTYCVCSFPHSWVILQARLRCLPVSVIRNASITPFRLQNSFAKNSFGKNGYPVIIDYHPNGFLLPWNGDIFRRSLFFNHSYICNLWRLLREKGWADESLLSDGQSCSFGNALRASNVEWYFGAPFIFRWILTCWRVS